MAYALYPICDSIVCACHHVIKHVQSCDLRLHSDYILITYENEHTCISSISVMRAFCSFINLLVE